MRPEPIAVVGMACRFPQSASIDAFWNLLHDGVDAITEVPADRWSVAEFFDADSGAAGKMNTKWGGFVDDVDRFDAGFFGVAPREAVNMDPQQRILLEVAWEALEDAAVPGDQLGTQSAGCFIGVSSFDYYERILEDTSLINGYTLTGNSYSIVANRLSYALNMRGPSMVVDTACSSSLVAIHLACQSLRSGESEIALAGGAHVLLSPWLSIAASKGEFMAPDGRCKSFDASANGYVRGEGVGVVVLKTLARARADGDRVHAVIRGSAVNQDGRSNGLTAPNPAAQELLLRTAYRGAGVEPAQVGYVEAHGTGTRLGDPIEMRALGTVLGEGRAADDRCLVGSVKTNFGHLEAAAGIAGFIKAVLAVERGVIPPSLHFREPNPLIDFARLPLAVPTAPTPWPPGPRVAGVSSFGFGGTNAHVVVEAAPPFDNAPLDDAPLDAQGRAQAERPAHLLALSAKSEPALRALAARYASFVRALPDAAVADAAHTAGVGRAHLTHRAAVVGTTGAELAAALSVFADGGTSRAVAVGKQGRHEPKVAFLYTGQGAQYPLMARELYLTSPRFRRTIDRCDEILRPVLAEPLVDVMFSARNAALLRSTAYAQPALFAVEAALTDLLASWGIVPAAVIGHSVGEFAACYAAGVFGLEDGLRLVAERGRLMQSAAGTGAMRAVAAGEAVVAERLAARGGGIAIAAVNGPDSVVVSGPADEVAALAAELTAQGIGSLPLDVSHAFHSAQMEPVVPALREALRGVPLRAPAIPVISNLTARRAGAELTTPEYWGRHAREPVRFADGIAALAGLGIDAFVEVGPKPTLSALARRLLPDAAVLLPTLRENGRDWASLLATAGTLYARGVALDWAGIDAGFARRKGTLPSYAFQRQRCWILDEAGSGPSAVDRRRAPAAPAVPSHPFLAGAARSAHDNGDVELRLAMSRARFPFLVDHRIRDTVVLPATAYVEIAQAAAAEIFGGAKWQLEDLEFRLPFFLSDDTRTLELVVSPQQAGVSTFLFRSADGAAETPRVFAGGKLRAT